MAISNNPLMQGVSGSFGKQLVFRQHNGRTIVSAYPRMRRRKLSDAQKKQNENLKLANAEVRRIKADDILRNEAQIRLNVTRQQLHHALLKEELLKLTRY